MTSREWWYRDTVHLINALTRPLFVYRMATGDTRGGADTRRRNALLEIERILEEHGWTRERVVIDDLTGIQRELTEEVLRDG